MIHIHFQGENAGSEAASFITWLKSENMLHLLSPVSAPVSAPSAARPVIASPSGERNVWEESPAVRVFRQAFPGAKLRPAGDENRHQAAIRNLRDRGFDVSIFSAEWRPSETVLPAMPETGTETEVFAPDGLDENDI